MVILLQIRPKLGLKLAVSSYFDRLIWVKFLISHLEAFQGENQVIIPLRMWTHRLKSWEGQGSKDVTVLCSWVAYVCLLSYCFPGARTFFSIKTGLIPLEKNKNTCLNRKCFSDLSVTLQMPDTHKRKKPTYLTFFRVSVVLFQTNH